MVISRQYDYRGFAEFHLFDEGSSSDRGFGSLQSVTANPPGWPSTSGNALLYPATDTSRPHSALSYRQTQRDYPALSPAVRPITPQMAFDDQDSPPDDMFPPDRITLNVFQTGPTEVRRVETAQPQLRDTRRAAQVQIPQSQAQQIARGGEGVLNDQITTTTTVEVFRTPIDLENPEKIILPPAPGIDDRVHLVRATGPSYERWTNARTETLINDTAPIEEDRRVQWSNQRVEEPILSLPSTKSPTNYRTTPPIDVAVPVLNTFDERWEPSMKSPSQYTTRDIRSTGRAIPITVERIPPAGRLSDPLQVDTSDSGDYMAPRRSDPVRSDQTRSRGGQGRRARIVEVEETREEMKERRRTRSGHRPPRHHRRIHEEAMERRNRSHSPQQVSRDRHSPSAQTHEGYFEAEFGPHTPNAQGERTPSGEIFQLYQTRDPLGNVIGHL